MNYIEYCCVLLISVCLYAGGCSRYVAVQEPDGGVQDGEGSVREGGLLAWAVQAGGAKRDYGHGIAGMPSGSCIVTGRIRGAATFGAGEVNQTLLRPELDDRDSMFVARYSPDGTLAWARWGGTASPELWSQGRGYYVAILPDESFLVTGNFGNSLTLGPGEDGETVLMSDEQSTDIFIARYDAGGNLLWAKRAGGSHYDECRSISALDDGSFYIAGTFTVAATFGPGEANEVELNTLEEEGTFLAKYESDGSLEWAVNVVNPGTGQHSWLEVSEVENGSCLVSGCFKEIVSLGDGGPNRTSLTSTGSSDVFVARYNPDGTLSWAVQAGGPEKDIFKGIAALPDGSSLVTGTFSKSITFGHGESAETSLISNSSRDFELFVARYHSDGTLAWARHAAAVEDGNGDIDVMDLSSVDEGSFVMTGNFSNTVIFEPGGLGETRLQSDNIDYVFVSKHHNNGTLQWIRTVEGSVFGEHVGIGIDMLPNGSVFATGSFYGSATFGPGEVNQVTLNAVEDDDGQDLGDIFVVRLEP